MKARKEHDDMPSKVEALQLNNFEVNRIFNMKKSNLDRINRLKTGKIDMRDYGSSLTQHTKKLKVDKNSSQIVFGPDPDDQYMRENRKSSLVA